MRRLEAVLFLAREPLNSRKLSQFANLADGTEARTLVRQLNGLYDQYGHAFRVEEVAGGFQLLSRPKFARWLRQLQHAPPPTRLSAPAMETLAVVAYRQPVLRADIEAIRGVSCGEILRQLMDRDLVRISGRSEELGRPYLYSTTRRFLQTFGLLSLDKLPRVKAMRAAPDNPPAENQMTESTLSGHQGQPSQAPERLKEESEVSVTTPVELQPQGRLDQTIPAAETSHRHQVDDDGDWDYQDYYEEDEDEDEDEGEDEEEEELEEDYDEEDYDEEDYEDEYEEEDYDEDEYEEGFEEDEEWEEVADDDDDDEDWEEDAEWEEDEDEDEEWD